MTSTTSCVQEFCKNTRKKFEIFLYFEILRPILFSIRKYLEYFLLTLTIRNLKKSEKVLLASLGTLKSVYRQAFWKRKRISFSHFLLYPSQECLQTLFKFFPPFDDEFEILDFKLGQKKSVTKHFQRSGDKYKRSRKFCYFDCYLKYLWHKFFQLSVEAYKFSGCLHFHELQRICNCFQ